MSNDFQKRLLEADSEYIASDYSGLSLYDISQKYNYQDISLEEAEKLYQNYELFWEDFSDYIQYMTKRIPISWMFIASQDNAISKFSKPNTRNHIRNVVLTHDEKINISMLGTIHVPFVYFVTMFAIPGGGKISKLKFVLTVSCRIGNIAKLGECQEMYQGYDARYEVRCNTREEVLDLYRKIVSQPTLPKAIKFMESFDTSDEDNE